MTVCDEFLVFIPSSRGEVYAKANRAKGRES